jgi:sugar phosphate isomerase/epimerase
MSTWNRRQFIKSTAIVFAGWSVSRCAKEDAAPAAQQAPEETTAADSFQISLAEWSLHRALRNGELDHLDFITSARTDYGLEGVEYVNQFFMDRAKDTSYLTEMKTRADGEGVHSLLIMCDGEGRLGDPDDEARTVAVENHYKWVEAAKFLGCHSIRVNAASEGSWDEQKKLAADGLRRLAEFGDEHGINVIVENHGGLSSNGQWLSEVIQTVDHPRSGTLPDFGNFKISDTETYDNYKGVEELMPFAKAVSAKSYDFDEDGNETELDYPRLVKIVLDAGYSGYIGIEYEGSRLSEPEGIRATKALLQRLQ